AFLLRSGHQILWITAGGQTRSPNGDRMVNAYRHARARYALAAILALAAFVALLVVGAARAPALAQGREISLIRDAEIEATLRDLAGPVFEAAGLSRDSVRLYIVNDDRLNAFVAGGMNLFLNTGIIRRAEHSGQLLGVIAHETGHIAGGHLSRAPEAMRRATAEAILATVLGAAAAMAGAGEVGTAIIAGGHHVAQQNLLKFSRTQEQAADQAAVTYLRRAGVSAEGLLEFFKILETQNALVEIQSPFLLTHPLTRERIAFMENQVATEPPGLARTPPGMEERYARMIAKLDGFLGEPQRVLRDYANRDGVAARYARAIAHYRVPDLNAALAELDPLIAEYPDDPYFHELRGQILFENGRIAEAIPAYRTAVKLRPDAALIRVGLGQALIESSEPGANGDALAHLKEAVRLDPDNATAWRLLGIAHGRNEEPGLSSLALAEYALLTNRQEDAKLYARRAEAQIPASDPAWLRVQDILRVLEES
ncbi:MAG TPA: M48 family metalloprotease, partial [Thermoleophilaceae bacterium]|nr:M48 family metalloprotease [Thermoleophilaceae bacterium]